MSDRHNFVITGASSDIGSALAQYLDEKTNSDLMLVSRTGPGPQLKRPHLRLCGIDLTKEADLLKLRDAANKRFVDSYAVVHCVGDFWLHKPLVQTDWSEITTMIGSHYLTLCGVAWALLPQMVRIRGGRLVALSCNSVAYNYPDMAPFTSAKAAVDSLIKCVANEYSQFNVIANAIALPTIRTPKVLDLKENGDYDHFITPAEVAALLVDTILSAPSIMNGNTLKVFRHSDTFFNQGYFERNPRNSQIDAAVKPPGSDTNAGDD
jgi:3-oxoacyl-[acyl-carrier protein] reductase